MRPPSLALLLAVAACSPGPAGPTTQSGTLEVGDMTLRSGEFFDPYAVRVTEGQWITVAVSTEGFDPYLIVRSPSGVQSEVDDSATGNTTSTQSVLRASEAGRWDVLVTSYAPGETGAYTVTIEVTDERPPGALTPPGPPTDSTITV